MAPAVDLDFETDDIYLAAYFKYCGCKYVGKRKAGMKFWFIFRNEGGDGFNELKTQFYSGAAVGKLHTFSQDVVAIKQLLGT